MHMRRLGDARGPSLLAPVEQPTYIHDRHTTTNTQRLHRQLHRFIKHLKPEIRIPEREMAKTKDKDKSSKTQSSVKPQAPAAAVVQPPNWPPFKPALPVVQLTPEAAVPGLEDKILLVRNFWPKNLCRDYVNFLKTLPLTTTPGRPKRGEAVRVNDRFQVDDHRFSQRLWLETGLKDALLEDSLRNLWLVVGKSLIFS